MSTFDTKFDPKSYEKRWYQHWVEKGYFAANDKSKKPYTILMPPPNITSQLHMGHGLGYTIQDLLVRWKRMKGFNALWLPGTDHAGIATQMMVEKHLVSEGLSRKEMGRDAFTERLHAWKDKYGTMIFDQMKTMGFSCDWNRAAYTLDPSLSKAVREVFVELYNEGLIYRGERLVNWDTVLQTAVSDDEVESKEVNGHLWYFRYPVADSDEYVPIATTRPETMLGDTAVAVNPEDERFQHLVGKEIELPLTGRRIPIVADEYVKSEFGTGAVKITPAHDPNDFEIGQRHNLPFLVILNDEGKISGDVPERFLGLDRFVARKEIIRALKELDLFDKEKSYKHAVPHSERSKTVIEPKLSKQWYVKMKELAGPAIEAAKSGELKFYPNSWKKTYLYWLENIQDWCISRQLWWGHRIPIWYCNDCQSITTSLTDPEECSSCHSKNIKQDEDVLDTWFSSWLWPMSPFGWAEDKKNEDLEYFNPTDVLVTAPEIIFLWVARMVMANTKFMKRLPFTNIYFNATVCDKKGRKFSKTLGNGIDPLEVVEKHGADAVRYTAISLAPLGGRVMMSVDDFDHGARFMNKIWNAARLLFSNLKEGDELPTIASLQLKAKDHWLLSEYAKTTGEVNNFLEQFRVNDAVDKLYHFIWGAFCDWGLECAKSDLKSDDDSKRLHSLSILIYVLDGALRLAHPVMPFITEEIWQKLPAHPDIKKEESIVIAAYPETSFAADKASAENWQRVQELISTVRSTRQTAKIAPKVELDLLVKCSDDFARVLMKASPWITSLARVAKVEASPEVGAPKASLSAVGKGYELYIPAADHIDIEEELQRLKNEQARLKKVIVGIEKKLNNKNFMDRAPEDIRQQTKEQFENLSAQIMAIDKNLGTLTS